MFSLKFKTSNAAFEDDPRPETVRILRLVASRIEGGIDATDGVTILDVNGSSIGSYKLTGKGAR